MTILTDGRKNDEIRPLYCSQGLLNRADGSARFEHGPFQYPPSRRVFFNTHPFHSLGKSAVLCGINGPMEVRLTQEKLDKATLEVVFRPMIGLPSTREKKYEAVIRRTFENAILTGLHPRTLIQLNVQILWDDGCALATAINAVTLALIDAGIPSKSIIAASTCLITDAGELIVDPTAKELEAPHSSLHTFAFDSATQEAVFSESIGSYTEEEYFRCLDICSAASVKVQGFLRTALEKKLEKENQY
ncbi:ribosomal protein S5 domain 2-like protein [Basidiobolus meristosporus CBS 931.73]|uniref:Ribosomal protein S5 domain 2-like protein n=1 Tax=Basidiobolus meristosporus CBS 931.73 TaxID=1314790 RepID=A0A1Y1YSG9_9FUNG|nr:ribosomal protein S5 domain 2-like protein [Basidiobolus meristosporus CBS 931.73]|eukprot:ORY00697.1 ribosomal protein S5 domain 2-like protein [Basidiobolus meristosporus CBS 931.73]